MARLIVNADDFGIHSAVNQGIIEGYVKGVLTSTSLLACGNAFEEAVELAHAYPQLGIGIHTALVGGLRPVCDPHRVPTLVTKDGVFPETYVEFMKWMYTGRINRHELYTELVAQCDKVMATGLRITHIDGHQHMHVLPEILPLVVALAKKHNLQGMRVPNEKALFMNGVVNPVRMFGKMGLSTLAARAYQPLRKASIRTTQHFWGMINGGNLTQGALHGILKAIGSKPGTHEIMTHPGIDNSTLSPIFRWGYHWQEELQGLCSKETHDLIRQYGIELINFGDLS